MLLVYFIIFVILAIAAAIFTDKMQRKAHIKHGMELGICDENGTAFKFKNGVRVE
jgi:hypothetical protein